MSTNLTYYQSIAGPGGSWTFIQIAIILIIVACSKAAAPSKQHCSSAQSINNDVNGCSKALLCRYHAPCEDHTARPQSGSIFIWLPTNFPTLEGPVSFPATLALAFPKHVLIARDKSAAPLIETRSSAKSAPREVWVAGCLARRSARLMMGHQRDLPASLQPHPAHRVALQLPRTGLYSDPRSLFRMRPAAASSRAPFLLPVAPTTNTSSSSCCDLLSPVASTTTTTSGGNALPHACFQLRQLSSQNVPHPPGPTRYNYPRSRPRTRSVLLLRS